MSGPRREGDIAIIGMAACFAGAGTLATYWQNILEKKDGVSVAPDSWAGPYYDPSTSANDRIYSRSGGFLGDLAEFDPREFGIMPNSVDGGEPDQFLALKLARDALKDSGYLDRAFNRTKTGVILGRGTYINRGYTNLLQHGLVIDQTLDLLRGILPDLDEEAIGELRRSLKESLPPFSAEMCPGLVPNVVAGRIANRLDLMGPSYIIDAACASSLIATKLAIEELRGGRCDMMLTGGIHASTPPQIYMIFSQLGGLSRSNIRPFDSAANGTLLGEGAGVLVLKRLADAERDKDRIYAVLKSIGSSSDGKALGLLAPRLEGEILASRRAYEEGDIDPNTIGLIEAHGTGIPLGDQTEISALREVFGERQGKLPTMALGSVKSMIGHCIPAAGAAGMIKAALALHQKVLPPTLAAEVSSRLGIETTPFHINTETRPWIHGETDHPRRAGVNAFGFGGVNAHAVLEEYDGSDTEPVELHDRRSHELVLFSAADSHGLRRELERVKRYVEAHPQVRLADIAFTFGAPKAGPYRAAIVAKDLSDLLSKLRFALERLEADARTVQSRNGIFCGVAGQEHHRIAMLFPGEGGQYPNMLADLCLHFAQVRGWFDFLDRTFAGRRAYKPSAVVFPAPLGLSDEERAFAERELYAMDLGSELVFVSSMALCELLGSFGIKADAMLGHSTGENTALIASGTVRIADRDDLAAKMRRLNDIYRELHDSGGIARGILLTVGGISPEKLREFLSGSGSSLVLAMDNCPNQAVLFGEETAIAAASEQLSAQGAVCLRLPFDRAYHTPLFESVSMAFQGFYDELDVGLGHTPLYTCATADRFPAEPAAIRRLAARQWHSQVRFRETIERLYEQGTRLFIEVGPSGNLTSFVDDILRQREHLALASNSRRRSGLEQLLHLLARIFVHGVTVDTAPLYRHRALARIDIDAPVVATQAKGKPILSVQMPILRAKAATIEKIRNQIRPANAVPAEAPAHTASNVVLHPALEAEDADPRLQMLRQHFGTMQEFLAVQSNVLMMLTGESGTTTPSALEGAPLGEDTDPWPLLGAIVSRDARQLKAEKRFDLDEDVFLRDHTLGSAPSSRDSGLLALPIIPFTFSMEILAQAALCLAGEARVVARMRELRGSRWLALDRGELVLRIEATLVESNPAADVVRVRLHQTSAGALGGGVLVFEGLVDVMDHYPAEPPAQIELEPGYPSRLNDALYSSGMFHGPRLQGVSRIRQWSRQGIDADLVTIGLEDFFSFTHKPVFRTDAGLLDAAGQLVGYWLSEQFGSDFNCFPFQVDTFEQYCGLLAPGTTVLCRARIAFTGEKQIKAQFELIDTDDRVIARIGGWQDRYFKMPAGIYECRTQPRVAYLSRPWMEEGSGLLCRRIDPLPEHFLDEAQGIWSRVLAHLSLSRAEREVWYGLPEQGPRRNEWLLGRIAAKDAVRQWASEKLGVTLAPADIEIVTNALGKPSLAAGCLGAVLLPELAITHSRGHTIAALVEPGLRLGIDLERFEGRPRVEDLLIGAFDPDELAELEGLQAAAREQQILARWCAKESAAKALGTGLAGLPREWRVSGAARDDRLTVTHKGRTFFVHVWIGTDEVFASCRYPAAETPSQSVQRLTMSERSKQA
jgi:acyl transferase domain-containing protein/phosphopantetheinyl transferase